jgi:hypothetical protein
MATTPLTIHEVAIEPLLPAASEGGKLHRLTAAELSNAEAAIARCTKAAEAARKSAEANGLTQKECRYRSIMAYKVNMPRMDTVDGCIEATSCVVAGFLAGFLDGNEVGKLLYAAQVAQSLLRSAR